MPDVASWAGAIAGRPAEAPWPGHEYARGWGIFAVPFDSGHVLALRVFAQSSFGPYRSVWHRDPEGRWSIYADAPRPDIACPRYYGPACDHVASARIDVAWEAARHLRVTMDEPRLEWTVSVARSTVLGMLNVASALAPMSSWRPHVLVRAREHLARALGMGNLRLAGTMPSGHHGLLMPQRMYIVDDSTATIAGNDLGRPARLPENPTIGDVPLPARGVLAVGQAVWGIRDAEEYARLRHDTDTQRTTDRETRS